MLNFRTQDSRSFSIDDLLSQTLIYDIEVFKYDWVIVFKRYKEDEIWVFHNGQCLTHDITIGELIQDYILVGFNNHFYDDKVITRILNTNGNNSLIKDFNDVLINGTDESRRSLKADIVSFDVFKQLPESLSLKTIEANMGYSIVETPLSFDIDRPLTPEELEGVIFYCTYDVRRSESIYIERRDYFYAKIALCDIAGVDRLVSWNTTTIIGNMFKGLGKWASPLVESNVFEDLPEELQAFYYHPDAHDRNVENFSKTFRYWNNDFDIGFGGAHSVNELLTNIMLYNVYCLDFDSLYPSVIILFKILGKFTEIYKNFRDQRLVLKVEGNPLSDAYKLILNMLYGILKNQYSPVYDPMKSRSVCFIGQQYIWYLSNELYEAGYEIVQLTQWLN